jgi:alpha-L-rhamnosidase
MDMDSHTWKGKWVWTRKHLSRPWNYYAYFRRTVDLRDNPRRAIMRISADARYTLYVNGRRVHYGPARSYPEHQSYDVIDIAQYLQAGKNAIGVIAHQFGIPTFLSVYRGLSGVLVDGAAEVDGETVEFHTPEGWVCRPAKGWRRDVTRMSIQLGFQEHFDADADPVDWTSPDYEAKEEDGWSKVHVYGPVGTHPWIAMEPRGIPLLAQHMEDFAAVIAQFRGENARGYKIADDVYHLAEGEKRRKEKTILEEPAAMLRDDAAVTTVPPPADGEFVMVLLDVGAYRTGHVVLDIAEAAGDEIIDIIYTEQLEKGEAPKFVPVGGVCEEATATRYRCRPGAQRWESFHYNGMRYAALVFRNVQKPLKVRYVGIRQVHADVPQAGSFQCSDDALNQIWQAGANTQLNCLFDAFVDCPWREQTQWWGDARVQGWVTSYAFGDHSVLARGIRQLAQSQAADGSLHSHPPAEVPTNRLPDFMMTWVGTLWDHYFNTGRTDLLTECLPVLHRLMDFFQGHEVRDGLIGRFDGWWVFLDWQALHKTDLSGVLNMTYLRSLRWAASICEIAGDTDGAARYESRADTVEKAIINLFWDDEEKLWRDGYDLATGKPVETVSQQMNALAILLDLKPDTHAKIARDVLVKAAQSKRTKILTGSPFFYAYIFEAIAKAGLRDEVVSLIREKWSEMLQDGGDTLWEYWTGSGSRCHAWSASPVYHLSQQVLGVRPVEPGWKRVAIAPLPGNLDYARGVVPSPLGSIRVDWEKVGEDQLVVHVQIPDGMEAEFTDPLGKTRTLDPGTHEFQT